MRCVIFAAVSSAPQAEADKASLPSQVANARAYIQRRGWQEVHPPLLVPGQSRHLDFLHEALEEIPALQELIALARAGTLDLVVVRDYDRLARTRSLLAQLSTYLQRCHVQIYALDKPAEPLAPADLARDSGNLLTGATLEAFAGLEAEREISRLRARGRFGKDRLAARGIWRHVTPPYGYTRTLETENGIAYLDVPRVVTDEAALIQRIEELHLRGESGRAIARALNLAGVPAPRAACWSQKSIGNILHNYFYAGYIVWGLARSQKVYDAASGNFITRHQTIPTYARRCAEYGGPLPLAHLLDAQAELAAEGAVITVGQHTPLRTVEQQAALDAESAARYRSGGRGASTAAQLPRLFTGFIVCGQCGAKLSNKANRYGYIYYACPNARVGGCTHTATVREDRLYRAVVEIIKTLARTPEAVTTYLAAQETDSAAVVAENITTTTKALAGLALRRARWDAAYEDEVIDLQTYEQKITTLRTEEQRLAATLTHYHSQRAQQNSQAALHTRLAQLALPDTYTAADRAPLKTTLRQLLAQVTVDNGVLTKLEFAL